MKALILILLLPISVLAQESKSDISLIGIFGNRVYSNMPINGSYEGFDISYIRHYSHGIGLEFGVFNTDHNHLIMGRDSSSVGSFGIEYGVHAGVDFKVVNIGTVRVGISPQLAYIYNTTNVYEKIYPAERLALKFNYREFELLFGSSHQVNMNKVYVGFGFTQRWN